MSLAWEKWLNGALSVSELQKETSGEEKLSMTDALKNIPPDSHEKLEALITSGTCSIDTTTASDIDEFLERMPAGLRGKDAPACVTASDTLYDKATFNLEQSSKLVALLTTDCNVQTDLPQKQRLMVFNIVAKHSREFGSRLDHDWVIKFIRMIDGERDPRCLLLSFTLHADLSRKLTAAPESLSELVRKDPSVVEDLFDVISCYFPVAYTPPRNESNPVTKKELKEKLAQSCSVRIFSNYAIPFAMDKLVSTLGEHKIDAMELMLACVDEYGDGGHLLLEPHMTDLWSQIRTEALQGSLRGDDIVLETLFRLVGSLSKLIARFDHPEQVHEHMRNLFAGVLNMASVREGPMNAQAYAALVHFAAASDPVIFRVVNARLLPLLDGAFREREEDEGRKISILSIYSAVLGAAVKLAPFDCGSAMLDVMVKSVLEMAEREPRPPADARIICAEALSSVIKLYTDALASGIGGHNFQPDSPMASKAAEVLTRLSSEATGTDYEKMTHNALRAAFATPSLVVATLLKESLLPAVFASGLKSATGLRPALCVASTAFEHLLLTTQYAMTHIESSAALPLLGQLAESVAVDGDNNAEFVAKSLEAGPKLQLDASCFEAAVASVIKSTHLHPEHYAALQLAFALLSSDSQRSVLQPKQQTLPLDLWCVFCVAAKPSAVAGLDAVLPGCSKSDAAESGPVFQLHSEFTPVEADLSKASVCLLLASRCNKGGIGYPENWSSSPHMGILACGALRRGGARAVVALEALQEMIKKQSPDTARQLLHVLQADKKANLRGLSRAFGHKGAPLWKQRAHHALLPVLLQKFEAAPAKSQESAAVFQAVSALLDNVPAQVVVNDAAQLLPMVVKTLEQQHEATVPAAVEILGSIVRISPSTLAKVPVLASIIPGLLACSTFKPSKQARIAALDTLRALAKSPETSAVCVTFKQNVIFSLRPALDDIKRNVRQAATEAVSAWHMLA